MRRFVVLVLCASFYGFALGSAHSLQYAARNLLKFPLLVLVTGLVCGLAYYVCARALGAPLKPRAMQRFVLTTFFETAVMLASLAPAILFLGVVMRHTGDGRVGEYYLFFSVNVIAVALAGSLALIRRARELCRSHGLARAASLRVVVAWLVLTLFVGGQASFYLRPFFGLSVTRGGSPPFCLGNTPDVRGATNFYEMVLLALHGTPLPERR